MAIEHDQTTDSLAYHRRVDWRLMRWNPMATRGGDGRSGTRARPLMRVQGRLGNGNPSLEDLWHGG